MKTFKFVVTYCSGECSIENHEVVEWEVDNLRGMKAAMDYINSCVQVLRSSVDEVEEITVCKMGEK